MSAQSKEENPSRNRKALEALMEECPCGGNPKDCQLYDLRKRTVEEKELWVSILSSTQKQQIFENHRECLYKRKMQ